MESNIKIHSIIIKLSIFVIALIAIVEMPNIFENALAQLRGGSQQDSSSGDLNRVSDGEHLSSVDRSIQDSEENIRDLMKHLETRLNAEI